MLEDPSKWSTDPAEVVAEYEPPSDVAQYQKRDPDHQALVAASDFLDVTVKAFEPTLQQARELESFIRHAEQRFGTDALVRIKTDILFRVRDQRSLSETQFRVLCAVYSKIGSARKPVRIRYRELRYRAAGFRSESVFRSFDDQRPLLTPKQVRNALDHLFISKFFSRFSTGNAAHYQHLRRMSNEALAEAVIRKRNYKRQRLNEARKIERESRDAASAHRQPGLPHCGDE